MGGENFLAIVPARKGSKGLIGKNMRDFSGKPLLSWTLQAALHSEKVTRTILSSDSDEAISLAEAMGIKVGWKRDAHLAEDHSTTLDVVEDCIYREANEGREYDALVVLEPTSPLRMIGEIDRVLSMLQDSWLEADAVITAGRVTFHPSALLKIVSKNAEFYFEDLKFENRRQDGTQAYLPTGNCFAIKTNTLLGERTFYPKRKKIYELEAFQTYEIDNMHDFNLVEHLFQSHRHQLIHQYQ